MADLRYPIKLDDDYPCRGMDAAGEWVYWEDLLEPGGRVGPTSEADGTPGEAAYTTGVVVEREDGLWAVAD